ncbi:hypothetical protein Adt_25215 [Abeliophyllum distichum]|uniref:Uncharacterized protein n=1 Tax=Abeliophyllum distichum TaxID=126358 RepID=A0ABD1SGF0_9LAMI
MLVMKEKVLRDLEKFEKCATDKDYDKKKAVAEVQSLLDKATAESKKKDNENDCLQKEVDQLRKKLETADDEAIARCKMSVEYRGNTLTHVWRGIFEVCYQNDQGVAG